MTEEKVKIGKNFLDLDKIIENKSKALHRMLPGFIVSYLKRIVHQTEMNDFIYRHRDDFGIDFANAIISDFEINISVINEEKIPKSGRYIFASNHPLGGFDGIAFITSLGFDVSLLTAAKGF